MSAVRAATPMWEGFIYLITGTALFVALLLALDFVMVMLS